MKLLIQGFVPTATTAVEEISSPISECINNSQLSRCGCRRRQRRRRRNCHQQGRRHHLLHSYPPIISHIENFEEMFGRNSDRLSSGEITALPTSTTATGDATMLMSSSIQMIDRTAAGFVGSSFLNSIIISPEGGDDSTTKLMILAGLSVVISMASLILSIQTTLRQREVVERGKDSDDVESSSSFDPSNKSLENVQNNIKTMEDLLKKKKKNLSSPYDDNDDIKSSNAIITTTIIEERATIENQVLAKTNNPRNELTVKPIGIVRSIYRLCVGTPRQGLLSPHARGRIELNIAKDAVSDLESFSHIWILFVFHLNTISKNQNSKISPPALGGKKVGILATRSPHRFNPIGITLAKLDHVEIKGKKQIHKKKKNQDNSKSGSSVILHISGLDLVDGTPVLDIKPYVPTYDSVNPFIIESNYMQQQQQQQQQQQYKYDDDDTASSTATTTTIDDIVKVPSWVSDGLATQRNVTISESAKQELERILDNDYDDLSIATTNTTKRRRRRLRPKLDFYGPNYFNNESKQDAFKNLLLCIEEVLSIDVRSNWQTKKARQGRSIAQRSNRIIKNKNKKNNTQQKKQLKQQQNNGNTVDEENDDGVVRQTKIPPASTFSTTSCTQQLDNLLIHFTITESSEIQRVESVGSGAEDEVYVTSIELLQ